MSSVSRVLCPLSALDSTTPFGCRRPRISVPGKLWELLELRVFSSGFFQNRNIRIGILPESKEIFVGGACPDPAGISVRSLRGVRLQRTGTSHSQMSQRACPAVPDDAAVVDDPFKIGGGRTSLSGCEIGFAANVGGIEAGNIGDELNGRQVRGRNNGLQRSDGGNALSSAF